MSTTFGKRSGGGRRAASREKLPLPAVVSTLRESITAEIIDVSSTGVRLKGSHLPEAGSLVSLKLDKIEEFGTVAWSNEEMCGVSFDEPLSSTQLGELRREVTIASMRWRSVDERLAARDWRYGAAR
jgi:hypothetical protein